MCFGFDFVDQAGANLRGMTCTTRHSTLQRQPTGILCVPGFCGKSWSLVQKELLKTLYVLGPCTTCHHLLLQRDSSAASTRGTLARTHTRTHTKVHTHLIKILHSILLLQPSAPPNAWWRRRRLLLQLLLLLLLSLKQLT